VQPYWTQPDAFQSQVAGIAVNDTSIFFGLYGPNSLWSMPIAGGAPRLLVSTSGGLDVLLATPAGVIFTEAVVDSTGNQTDDIVSIPAAGGAPTTLAAFRGWLRSLVADEAALFFSDAEGTKTVPLAGGTVSLLTSRSGTLGLVGPSVVIADAGGGNVFSIPKTGGSLTTLATSQPNPAFPVSCGEDICWLNSIDCAGLPDADVCVADEGEGALVRLPPQGAPVTLAEASTLYGPTGMTFDGASFLVTIALDASVDGPLVRVPAAGGAPVVIGSADSAVVSGACVYVIDWNEGVYTLASE
jgi:hypothetical protein